MSLQVHEMGNDEGNWLEFLFFVTPSVFNAGKESLPVCLETIVRSRCVSNVLNSFKMDFWMESWSLPARTDIGASIFAH